MSRRQRSKAEELTRNLVFVAIAILVIVIFFSLDIFKGAESMFSRNTIRGVKFSGQLERKDFSRKELDRLRSYMKARNKILKEIIIQTSTQDSYRKISPDTEVLFEVRVVLQGDEFTFDTSLRRSKRKALVSGITAKINKDLNAYNELKKQGKKPKTLINTM